MNETGGRAAASFRIARRLPAAVRSGRRLKTTADEDQETVIYCAAWRLR
jgi:hypothetical protein